LLNKLYKVFVCAHAVMGTAAVLKLEEKCTLC